MKVREVVLVAACTFLIIIGSYLALPIGPVPVVLTNFFIMLIGLLLGWKRALLAVITYILLGAVGLPVFSSGRGGLAHIFGLTGGFIFSYIPLAFLTGLASDKGRVIKLLTSVFASILVYVIGVPWALYVYNTVIAPANDKQLWDLATALKYTAIPFLLPNIAKIVAAVFLSELLKPVLKPFIKTDDE